MTRFPTSHRPRRDPGPEAHEEISGALLRVPVADRRWAERLPPVPAGVTVTVSLSSAAVDDAHADALRFLGYRVVEPSGVDSGAGAVADFVVGSDEPARHPSWWRALAPQAQRVYPLAFGPVLAALDEALRPHRAHLHGSG